MEMILNLVWNYQTKGFFIGRAPFRYRLRRFLERRISAVSKGVQAIKPLTLKLIGLTGICLIALLQSLFVASAWVGNYAERWLAESCKYDIHAILRPLQSHKAFESIILSLMAIAFIVIPILTLAIVLAGMGRVSKFGLRYVR